MEYPRRQEALAQEAAARQQHQQQLQDAEAEGLAAQMGGLGYSQSAPDLPPTQAGVEYRTVQSRRANKLSQRGGLSPSKPQQHRNLPTPETLGRAPGNGGGYGYGNHGSGGNGYGYSNYGGFGNNGVYRAYGGPVAEYFERLVEWERVELKAHKLSSSPARPAPRACKSGLGPSSITAYLLVTPNSE